MKFINPVDVTPAVLVSSNVAEADYAAWSSGATYALSARCISTATHKVYESLQAGNINHDPTADDGTWWAEVSATNRWKMFDQGVGSQTENASSIEVTLAPGLINSIALLDIVASSVQVVVVADGSTLYDETFTLGDGAVLADWFEYFFADIDTVTNFTVVGLPVFSGGELTVTVNAPVTAKVGTLAVGRMVEIGRTRSAPRVGIVDYSRKQTDEWGKTTVAERSFARRVEAEALILNSRLDYIANQLAAVRAKPCVWIADDSGRFEAMTIYGFYKDWGINISYQDHSDTTISIEGLT